MAEEQRTPVAQLSIGLNHHLLLLGSLGLQRVRGPVLIGVFDMSFGCEKAFW